MIREFANYESVPEFVPSDAFSLRFANIKNPFPDRLGEVVPESSRRNDPTPLGARAGLARAGSAGQIELSGSKTTTQEMKTNPNSGRSGQVGNESFFTC